MANDNDQIRNRDFDRDDSGEEREEFAPRRRRNDDGDDGDDRGRRFQKGRMGRNRHTQYCPEGKCFDYKDFEALRRYVNETGKIKPRRQTGNCARCQRELAREIENWQNRSLKEILFIIGGQDGVSEAVIERANFKLSLSKMTFTHETARVVLLEQIYRAFTIIHRFPYQK